MAQPIANTTLDNLEHRITLTVEEVASLLGLGRTATYEAARRGQLPSRRLGRGLSSRASASRLVGCRLQQSEL